MRSIQLQIESQNSEKTKVYEKYDLDKAITLRPVSKAVVE